MITVKELIEQLSELPPDLEVLMANTEDDTFRPFEMTSVGFAEQVDEHHPNFYEFHQEEYYEVDNETGESDYPGDNAAVLWPE